MISFDDFKKLELCVAKVLEVKDHPNADRLWVLTVDAGGGATKEIVAGIKEHYPSEDLVGKSILLVNNLEPATIRGVTSHGMILAVRDGDVLGLATVDKPITPGSKIS